jgi:hypothetical protein
MFFQQVDNDVDMVSQEFSQTNVAHNNMQQQANTLQVNQVNAQVTNVFNYEQQQLITLQVTAAAATQIAEAQMAAQLQVAAADNVVQQQNAHVARLTPSSTNRATTGTNNCPGAHAT